MEILTLFLITCFFFYFRKENDTKDQKILTLIFELIRLSLADSVAKYFYILCRI